MNFTAAFKWSAVLAVLAATFWALPCVAGEGATLIPPNGWTESAAPFSREGFKVLFFGRRTDRTGQMSTLVVSHVAQLTARKEVRDFFGGYLDSFAKRDPYLFLQTSVEKVSLDRRCAVYVKVSGRNLHPRKEDFQTYIFMTEAGIYNVQFTTEGEDRFNIEEFLKESLTISAKEAEFAEEIAGVFVEAIPKAKAEELKRLNQLKQQIAQPSTTNEPPDLLVPALGMATFSIIETSAYRGTNAFAAKVIVEVRTASAKQTMPLTIQKSGQKTRAEVQLTDFGTFPTSARSALQRLSLERLVTIFDLTTKRLQVLLPDADAYLEIQAPSLMVELMDRDKVYLVPLGIEDWQGHSCEKVQYNETGRTNRPAQPAMVAWTRLDLDKFPVRIEITPQATQWS